MIILKVLCVERIKKCLSEARMRKLILLQLMMFISIGVVFWNIGMELNDIQLEFIMSYTEISSSRSLLYLHFSVKSFN